MKHEDIRKTVNDFMNALLKENLIKFTKIDKKTQKIFANSKKLHDLELSIFSKVLDANRESKFFTDDEYSLYLLTFELIGINHTIEEVKIILRLFLVSKELGIVKNSTYGEILGKCFQKLHYDGEIRSYMKDIFLLDLRNAYTHLDYEINGKVFSYEKQNGEPITCTIDELKNIQLEYIETNKTILAFFENTSFKKKVF